MRALVKLHPVLGAEIRGVDTTDDLSDEVVTLIKGALAEHGVLVFRGQRHLDDEGQLRFSARFGDFHRSITVDREDLGRRLERDELSDITNVDVAGEIMAKDDASRISQRGTRLWHTDNSFRDPAGLYTFLHGRVVPDEGGDTEFADIRAAFDALADTRKKELRLLRVDHSLAHTRLLSGHTEFFENQEQSRFPGVEQPLVRAHEESGREALYIGAHAARVTGWSYSNSRVLLEELLAHATQERFVYRHRWSTGDLVVWDNRSVLHRATPFDDEAVRREMRRTSLIIPRADAVTDH